MQRISIDEVLQDDAYILLYENEDPIALKRPKEDECTNIYKKPKVDIEAEIAIKMVKLSDRLDFGDARIMSSIKNHSQDAVMFALQQFEEKPFDYVKDNSSLICDLIEICDAAMIFGKMR